MHLFILGILVAQFTYIAIQWAQLRYREYLYYGAYIGTFIVYVVILFRENTLGVYETSPMYMVLDSFKRPIAFLLYFEYFIFAQYFIGLESRFPPIYRMLKPFGKIILGF